MSDQLKRVLSLARKTGDRIVVFDNSEPDNSFVVMGLDQYEEMMSVKPAKINNLPLTEGKNADRINGIVSEDNQGSGQSNFAQQNGNKPKNNWNIPDQVRNSAENYKNQQNQ